MSLLTYIYKHKRASLLKIHFLTQNVMDRNRQRNVKRAHTPCHKPKMGTVKEEAFFIARDRGHTPSIVKRTSARHEHPKYDMVCAGCGRFLEVVTHPATISANIPFFERAYAESPISGTMFEMCDAQYHTSYRTPRKKAKRAATWWEPK